MDISLDTILNLIVSLLSSTTNPTGLVIGGVVLVLGVVFLIPLWLRNKNKQFEADKKEADVSNNSDTAATQKDLIITNSKGDDFLNQ